MRYLNRVERFALTVAIYVSLGTSACQTTTEIAQTGLPQPVQENATRAASPAEPQPHTFEILALVDGKPLAGAEVVIHDPLANAPARAHGDGVALVYAGGMVHTDARGHASLVMTLAAGQAAEVYVSDGTRSACALLCGKEFALRYVGKTPIEGAQPLVVDTESTAVTSLMLGSLRAIGKVVAAQQITTSEKLASQARAIDTIASKVGTTAAKMLELAGTANVATAIATQMLQADPRLPARAGAGETASSNAYALMAVPDDAGPEVDAALRALCNALRTVAPGSSSSIVNLVKAGTTSVTQALQATFVNQPIAASLQTELAQHERTAQAAATVSQESNSTPSQSPAPSPSPSAEVVVSGPVYSRPNEATPSIRLRETPYPVSSPSPSASPTSSPSPSPSPTATPDPGSTSSASADPSASTISPVPSI